MRLDRLAERVAGARVRGRGTVEVAGIRHDSREVRPGDLFVCLTGARHDGHAYAGDAMARGAAALCVDEDHASLLPAAPALVVGETRRALPPLAAAFWGDPSLSLRLVGVTGTNGKTTTMLLAAAILNAAGLRAGTIGTLGADLMGEALPAERTTPEADQFQELLAQMRDRGAAAVACEVSSHALAQHRTDATAFDAGIFTNLTQDHLDYHAGMEEYYAAKLRLFVDYPGVGGKEFVAAINADDPWGRRLASEARGRVVTYAVEHAADVRARAVEVGASRVSLSADTPAGVLEVQLRIGGAFQIYNALAAAAAAIGMGIPVKAAAAGLESLRAVPGRFESVPTGRGFHAIVDYAHTPDGLENLISAARRLNPRRLILVFGCGGDRDRSKRPLMGRIAGSGAEVVVVTSDNPRTEDPAAIISEVLAGLGGAAAKVCVEPDRRAAIALALAEAQDGDLVLVAGKGHEDCQEIQGVKHPFDDRAVIRELLDAAK